MANANAPIYFGKPENQRDPRAVNVRPKAPVAKDSAPSPQTQAPSKNTKKMPPTLPPGSRAHLPQPKKEDIVDKSPFDDFIFQEDMSVREVNLHTTQSPSLAAINEISRATFQQMRVDEPNLSKQWTSEVFDYYTTAMAWLRIVHLKAKTSQPLTTEEESLIAMTSSLSFNLPEPIRLYLSGIGVTTTRTGQHLYPSFPPLPTTVVEGIPGLYGALNTNTHNLYEEIPALGISVGMIKASLNPARPLPQWQPPIMPANTAANPNLLGYRNVQAPRMEATSILDSAGVSADAFPNHPRNTGFNLQLLKSVSAILANITTFKITPINFLTLSENGSPAQALISKPVDNDNPAIRCVNGDLRAESLTHEALGMFGQAIVFCFQLVKEPVGADHTPWACITPAPGTQVPEDWIANRNQRRDSLPNQYRIRVFNSVSLSAGDYRLKIVEKLVKEKR